VAWERRGDGLYYYQSEREDGRVRKRYVGRERVYPELRRAIEERTPELLRMARFEPSRHKPGTYLRRPGGAA
jgi:hypothetical protein